MLLYGCWRCRFAFVVRHNLSPFQPERAALKAGRLMLMQMAEYAARGHSFAFETTISGRASVRDIHRWQQSGYQVERFFLALLSLELTIERVRRVRQGGHHVPEHVTRRPLAAGRENFDTLYKPLVDPWVLYDNDGQMPQLLDWRDWKRIRSQSLRPVTPTCLQLGRRFYIQRYVPGKRPFRQVPRLWS
jgi:predicted ABC-type ATPase